ncbi:MAG: PH domain-containing protein [Phycisphaerae bacterium]
MTPSAEPTPTQAADATEALTVPQEVLQDGEVVILAVKPSRWFVLLASGPAWLVALAILAIRYLTAAFIDFSQAISTQSVFWICFGLVMLRVIYACLQWSGRLYILTNMRVIRIRGVFRPNVIDIPLRHVEEVEQAATVPERRLACGSLIFHGDEDRFPATMVWMTIANLQEVRELVEETIRRSRRRPR